MVQLNGQLGFFPSVGLVWANRAPPSRLSEPYVANQTPLLRCCRLCFPRVLGPNLEEDRGRYASNVTLPCAGPSGECTGGEGRMSRQASRPSRLRMRRRVETIRGQLRDIENLPTSGGGRSGDSSGPGSDEGCDRWRLRFAGQYPEALNPGEKASEQPGTRL